MSQLAVAQFTGYREHENNSMSIISLVDSMGLKEYEWNYIKETYNSLVSEHIEDIDEYFKKMES